MKLETKLNNEEVIDRARISLILIGIALTTYYTIFDYLDRRDFENTPLLVICVTGLIFGAFLHKRKYRKTASVFFLLPSQIFMTFLIYKSGGLQAPGIFWFSVVPVFWSMILGIKGLLSALAIIIITFIHFFIFRESIPLPQHYFVNNGIFYSRLENLIMFSAFISVVVVVYTRIISDAHAKLEGKQKEIETLLRILVHDISNPLTVTQFYCSRIQNTQQYEPKSMEKVAKSVHRVTQIVSDVRRLFALSKGKIALNKEKTNLVDCVQESIQNLQNQLEEKNIHIDFKVQQNPLFANIDSSIFNNQVLVNILSNAIKFSPEKGKIYIEIFEQNHHLIIEITDEGVGVPQDLLPHLFSAEHPTSRLGTNGEQGTGFGLPIVKQILIQHGAEIQILSPPLTRCQRGTQVIIKLPVS